MYRWFIQQLTNYCTYSVYCFSFNQCNINMLSFKKNLYECIYLCVSDKYNSIRVPSLLLIQSFDWWSCRWTPSDPFGHIPLYLCIFDIFFVSFLFLVQKKNNERFQGSRPCVFDLTKKLCIMFFFLGYKLFFQQKKFETPQLNKY